MEIKRVKNHIKKGDQVKVIAGNEREKIGKVLAVYPRANRALVEGINKRVYHIKQTRKKPSRREVREASVHISNLMLLMPGTKDATRIGRKKDENGKLKRYAKRTGEFI